ncbi:hypothetical protein FXF51_01720 [Nonomuraea sp. PA05]|uniref:hypothetical protein n=1 Tax=Nonomuraea sp. PA05 TaxID=2604466 RepID=UPI0011D749FF|nr:hypothetical protein [Nonomuraea sp. PA05]TYB71180.1 hypothetical protein FXF51_01720 [Nonomuraea sp. PA05]
MSTRADAQMRAIDEAAEVLAKRMREWAATPADEREAVEVFTRRFMLDLNGHGWRLTPAARVNPLARRSAADPAAAAQRGAALAFAELAKVMEKRAVISQAEGDEE